MKKPELSDKTKKILKSLLFLFLKIAAVVLVVWLCLVFVFGVYRLGGNNMYPALKDGDLCVTYKLDGYYKDDIVAYEVNGEIRFGRIIAREGDTVDGDEEGILLNGAHITEEIFYSTDMMETNLELPVQLEKGEFIVLNDYREDRNDSRTYGVVTEDSLKGKIIFIFRRRGF